MALLVLLDGVCAIPAFCADLTDLPWKEALPGFDKAEFNISVPEAREPQGRPPLPGGIPGPALVILRVDPNFYTLTLHMASEAGPQTLPELAEEHELLLALNAGMFLPDKLTSTGYMRNISHVNNARMGGRLGALLLANPKLPGLPRALLLDKQEDNWQENIDNYDLAIQNFRLIDPNGKVLWPGDAPPHSIVLLGQDGGGRLLFIFCRGGINPAGLAQALLELPLDLRGLMYLEGGSPAAMLLRAGDERGFWSGNPLSGFLGADPAGAVLPNVLGVKRR